MLHLSKQHVFLESLVENKEFYFSKRALHAGIYQMQQEVKISPDNVKPSTDI